MSGAILMALARLVAAPMQATMSFSPAGVARACSMMNWAAGESLAVVPPQGMPNASSAPSRAGISSRLVMRSSSSLIRWLWWTESMPDM